MSKTQLPSLRENPPEVSSNESIEIHEASNGGVPHEPDIRSPAFTEALIRHFAKAKQAALREQDGPANAGQ